MAVTGGALTVTATTDGEQEELFSIQYPEEPASAESWPVVEPTVAPTVKIPPPGASLTITSAAPIMPQLTMDSETDVKPVTREASSSGGTIAIATASPIVVNVVDTDDAQDVPEPSIILGFLGTAAWMVKQNRKQLTA